MEKSGLIFIPDISGFTQFVTQTEIRHSNHIITELIELLLESNESLLKISEIEGDAILFYKLDELPNFEELWELIKSMFLNFHSYLKVIERDRVCQCGACSTASKLSLKFIVHFGIFNEVQIQNFTKLMGIDVILAHRLLKNRIVTSEYTLFTSNYLAENEPKLSNDEHWAKLTDYSHDYENFGQVKAHFIELSKLKDAVPQAPNVKTKSTISGPPDMIIKIKAPPALVHQTITDHTLKPLINPKIRETRGNEINRLNGSHTCVFDDLEIHFVTTGNNISSKEMVYSERADIGLGFTFTTDFRIIGKDYGSELSVRIRPDNTDKKEKNIIKKLLNDIKIWFVLGRVKSQTRKGMRSIVDFIEKEVSKPNAI